MQVLAVVSLNHYSGKPEDRVINTFCFEYPGTDVPATDTAIAQALVAFYNTTAPTATRAVGEYINDSITRTANACWISIYSINNRLAGEPHGSPLSTYGFTLVSPAAAGVGYPAEVALCGSFHASYGLLAEEVGGMRPKNRRRGRIFIGPLVLNQGAQDVSTHRTGPNANMRGDLTKAMNALMNEPNSNWCVWSRADQLTLSVVGGFVDDAFDTQRRRGEAAVTRSVFGA